MQQNIVTRSHPNSDQDPPLTALLRYEADDPRIHHGRLFSSLCLAEPAVSGSEAGAAQLEDEAGVAAHKLRSVRQLLGLSKRTLVYTEAATSHGQHPAAAHYGAKQCGITHNHGTCYLVPRKINIKTSKPQNI